MEVGWIPYTFGNQVELKLWKVKKENLKPYQQYLENLTKNFDKIDITLWNRTKL